MVLYVTTIIAFIVVVSSEGATICDEEQLYTFIPDVRDCNAWFYCGLNGPVRGTCSNKRVFNPRTRLCDWPQNVDCFQCPSNVGMHKIPMQGSCRMFIRCISGTASQSACEYGLQFNQITGQCDLKSVVQCGSGYHCPDELPNNSSFIAIRDIRNCSVYHLCIGDAKPIRQECNPELHFDPITSLCTYPNYTDCSIHESPGGPGDGPGGPKPKPEPEPTESTKTTLPTEPPTPSDPPTEPPTPSEPPTEPTTEILIEPPIELSDEPFGCLFDGAYTHPTECNEYFICANNVPHHMRCAEGLHFNVAISQCDFPENANCHLHNFIFQEK